MLVACKSFITTYAGAEVRLITGISHVAEGHAIAQRHPLYFSPAEGRAGARHAIRAGRSARLHARDDDLPSFPRGLEAWRILKDSSECRLAYTVSMTRIRFAAPARNQLLDIVRSTTEIDGDEVGGLLFGSRCDQRLLEVLDVSGPGENCVRERSSFRYDPEHNQRITDEMGARGLAPCGEWHSHPASTGHLSPEDLVGASRRRQMLQVSDYLTVLATPTLGGWQLIGWMIRAGGSADVCERARMS